MCFGGAFEISDQTEEREISVPERLAFQTPLEVGFQRERGRGGGEKGEVDIVFEDFQKVVVQWYSLGKKNQE